MKTPSELDEEKSLNDNNLCKELLKIIIDENLQGDGDYKKIKEHLKNNFEDFLFTKDNFINMVMLYLRIRAGIPTILMGETGCGKTYLVKMFSLLFSQNAESFYCLKFHAGITDDDIIDFLKKTKEQVIKDENKIINELNEYFMKDKKRNKLSFRKAENKKKEEMWFYQRWFFTSKYEEQFKRYDKGVKENIEKRIKKRKIIIFFDEINTCYSLDLIKRLICDENFRKKYDIPERFVIICACNPWRVLTDELKKLQFGLSLRNKEKRKLVYTVNPLPYSLLNFVFYFNNLTEETMLKYIQKMIDNIKSKISEKNKQLIMILLIESHLFIIKKGDASLVSLREIKRFKEIFEFFNEKYFKIYKKEENNDDDVIEIKSIALSIYLCYYLRLPSNELRENYINEVIKKNINISLIEIAEKESIFITKKVLTNQEGYGKNKALCENIFSEFICILLKMPLIICGKPGSSKSLSIRLLLDVMNGEKSDIEFFKQFPKVVSFYYQCSLTSTSEKIEKIFENAYKKLEKRNYEIISLICMDEMGIADESQNNPLKVLHSQFDENSWKKNDNEKEKIAFVGISNWTLDASKMNRTLYINLGEPNIDYIETKK